jgi:hypothetical protein
MDKLGLRKMSFPFDWVRTNNLDNITELIQNKFQFFFDDLQIIDNDGVVYSFTPNSMSNARQEVDEYISQLITSIRQERINKLITE